MSASNETTRGGGFKLITLLLGGWLRVKSYIALGGTSALPGGATVAVWLTKAITAFTDTTAKDVLTVTVPNNQCCGYVEIDALGVMGAGGAIGAGETVRLSKYQVAFARTAGLACVITVSAAIGGVQSKVAGADDITSVVVTASAVTGGNTATQTFTIKVAITKAAGAAAAHTCVVKAMLVNQNASGATIA